MRSSAPGFILKYLLMNCRQIVKVDSAGNLAGFYANMTLDCAALERCSRAGALIVGSGFEKACPRTREEVSL
jgi:hypothetical protein